MPTPYLFFDGRAQEAIDFYQKALGARVEMLMRFKDNRSPGRPAFQGFALPSDAADEADAKRRFQALADGGQVQMPLGETFFARAFGMVADRFGFPGW